MLGKRRVLEAVEAASQLYRGPVPLAEITAELGEGHEAEIAEAIECLETLVGEGKLEKIGDHYALPEHPHRGIHPRRFHITHHPGFSLPRLTPPDDDNLEGIVIGRPVPSPRHPLTLTPPPDLPPGTPRFGTGITPGHPWPRRTISSYRRWRGGPRLRRGRPRLRRRFQRPDVYAT